MMPVGGKGYNLGWFLTLLTRVQRGLQRTARLLTSVFGGLRLRLGSHLGIPSTMWGGRARVAGRPEAVERSVTGGRSGITGRLRGDATRGGGPGAARGLTCEIGRAHV